MESLFTNNYGRIRSGLRAAIFILSFLLIAEIFIYGALALVSEFSYQPESPWRLVPLVLPFAVSTVIALLLGWMCGRVFESLPFRALGCTFTRGWGKHLALGTVIGSVAFAVALIIGTTSGGLTFSVNRSSEPSSILLTLATSLLIFVVAAASEETLLRGYLLQTFFRARLAWIGTFVSALLFAFAHRLNPDVTSLALLNTLLAGIWFCVAYMRTRDLWFPFGIHLAWNFLQGPILGINVSGIRDLSTAPVVRAADLGPSWLTGGAYGIEGGAACTVAIAIAVALTLYLPGLVPDDEMLELTSKEQPSSRLDLK